MWILTDCLGAVQSWWRRVSGEAKGLFLRARTHLWWKSCQAWHRIRKRFGLLPDRRERRIVIGVGMHRTGTRSLASYLRDLGFKDLHWPWWCERQISPHVEDAERVADVLEPLFYRYDCFLDVPFPGLYRVLDRRFPNSRFILVRRDPMSWWRSISRHWELDKGARRLDAFEELVYRQYAPADKVLITKDDAPVMLSKFNRHYEEVQAFFGGRSGKLLVVNLEDDDLNVQISRFLDAAALPYPHESDAPSYPREPS